MRTRWIIPLVLCLLLSGCATSQWLGKTRRALRDPGERLIDLPDQVAGDYGCAERTLPYLEVERNEVNPRRVEAGAALNHRIVYALCPRTATEVVSGTLTTQVRFKGRVVMRDRVAGFEFKPGRWSVDTFVRLPEDAETGVYALEIRFHRGGVRVDESLTFGVDG
jgi:hypothetical protein